MSEPDKPPSLEELGTRIKKMRSDQGLDQRDDKPEDLPPSGELGMAWRMSIELVVALVICTGLGWVFDQWFETTPWAMVVSLFLGAAAGINNAVRTMNRMDGLAAERTRANQPGGEGGRATTERGKHRGG